ncbi:surface-adhesin E family protein [Flavobacterium wongokense]|uniref:surface-adhesin E family protein n=1 Tax=Flavobacterium wongokense TaxID=2910674 RepID=UPI001F3BB47A|nr:surface-adhesin E family protein [Flavobacterium sp. WG47]MCF6131940.1 hypothetical protein [Flavobacterium sp. WG47]
MKKQLLLLLLLIGSACSAQDWQYLTESNNNVYYYKLNSRSTAWVKVVSETTSIYASNDDAKPTTVDGYTVYLYKYSCSSKKIGLIKTIVYSKDGKLLDTRSTDELLADMESVKPNSIGEEMLFQFCYGR